MNQRWVRVAIAIGICELAGIIGSVFTASAIPSWYVILERPAFAPPNWVFGPVWTTLYAMMGVSLYLVWQQLSQGKPAKKALYVFGVQLLLNTAWSIIFFGLQSPGAAFVEIIFLWLSIALTILLFWQFSKTAALLLVPYIAWVSFAAFLNYTIWMLN